ncbi:TPA: hypothetical protein DIV49_01100 [Candidatus Saccharibacteria bacterium]|mgnify:CR=1 FL=1|nr:hypothetical protein [Candidatus Saccharibacteria bacterium]HRJ90652.1 response regulator [Candidatus Saccharibacteria bacterium]
MTKILLVEDDKSLREIYGVRLLAEGYDIVSAGDGEEALAMAIKERPELIVSDVMMPKISGFDMLDILRSTTETKDIKVIMMTALSSEDQRQRGEQLGADRYLVKSQVGIEDVVRTVHEVLGDVPTAAGAAAPAPTPIAQAPSAPAAAPAPEPAEPATAGPVAPRPAPATAVPPRPDEPLVPSAPTPEPVAAPPAAPTPPLPAPEPVTTAEPASSVLPQPSSAPAAPEPRTGTGLADRVIQPLEKPEGEDPKDLADMMNKELGDTPAEAAAAAPAAPTSDEHGIEFEETPRENPTA